MLLPLLSFPMELVWWGDSRLPFSSQVTSNIYSCEISSSYMYMLTCDARNLKNVWRSSLLRGVAPKEQGFLCLTNERRVWFVILYENSLANYIKRHPYVIFLAPAWSCPLNFLHMKSYLNEHFFYKFLNVISITKCVWFIHTPPYVAINIYFYNKYIVTTSHLLWKPATWECVLCTRFHPWQWLPAVLCCSLCVEPITVGVMWLGIWVFINKTAFTFTCLPQVREEENQCIPH